MGIEWLGDGILAAIRDGEMEGLRLAGEHLLQVSSTEVPHEEGDLERSGDVDEDEAAQQVSVYYDRPYAEVQHEDMTLRHDQGRKAKFLEDPMNAERDTMLQLIDAPIRRALQE